MSEIGLIIPGSKEKLALVARAAEKLSDLRTKERCEESLMDFASYVWPIVEPSNPFVKGWVLEAICEHLEAVTYGHIRRLLINVPPGFTKSLMTDVFWPAWEWGPKKMPWLRYVCASYSSHLTERDNMRCRNIIVNERYKRLWGDVFTVSNDQFTKVKFANSETGWKLATSVGGIGVGERGDRFLIDDPNNTMEVESETIRDTTKTWFTEVVPDRLNNQQKSAIVVIQQRLHEGDVSGIALSREMGYTHLMIPMEHDVKRHCVTVLGVDDNNDEVIWEDPRSKEGELAWKDRFPDYIVEELKRDKDKYAYAGQYQQSPVPRGGSIIKDYYWNLWGKKNEETPPFPPFEYILACLDSAYTAQEENDPSALTVWGLWRDEAGNPKLMLIHAWREWLEFNALVTKVITTCTKGNERTLEQARFPVDRLLIEAKASGLSAAQEIYRLTSAGGRFGVQIVDPTKYGDKVARAYSIEHLFHDGLVYAPDKSWADMVIDECAIFPKGSHDDLVDTVTMALRYMRDTGMALRREEQAVDTAEELKYRGRLKPLYPC